MKRISITAWIFIGMIAGILLGFLLPDFSRHLPPVTNIFLRLIKSVLAPLLFGTLVAGIAASGSVKTMGRIGLKAIIYFEIVTTLALIIGLAAVNLTRPGDGLNLRSIAAGAPVPAPALPSVSQFLEHVFPSSVIDAMARGEVLQIVVFCFIFGAASTAIGAKARPVVDFAASLAEVMFRYTHYIMYFAPFAVAAALAFTVAGKGSDVLISLAKLILTLYAALIVFVVAVLIPVILICRIPIRRFYHAVKEPWLIAFSTSASEAALPVALENMEKFGVPKHIVGFVLPTGYSFNLDGSTLYLSLASVFCAQAVGIELTLSQQLMLMLTLMFTSKGVAGVPRAAIVILSATLVAFQIPVEGVAVVLGVDAIIDMARTSINVLGNCLAAAVVARWEGIDFSRPHSA